MRLVLPDGANARQSVTTGGRFTLQAPTPKGGGATSVVVRVEYTASGAYENASTAIALDLFEATVLRAQADRHDAGVRILARLTDSAGPVADADLVVATPEGIVLRVRTNETGTAALSLAPSTAGRLLVRFPGSGTLAPAEADLDVAALPGAVAGGVLGLWAALALAALVLDAYILWRALQRRRLARELDRVIESLLSAGLARDEYQAAVLNAYLQLRAVAELYDVPDPEHATAREFGSAVAHRLRLPREDMAAFMGIFEAARYGRVAGPSERDEVARLLTRIRRRLVFGAREGGAPA